MEKKKLKLKISEGSKKTINNIELAKSKASNSVVIEKKNIRGGTRSSFSNINNQKSQNKNNSFSFHENLEDQREIFEIRKAGLNILMSNL